MNDFNFIAQYHLGKLTMGKTGLAGRLENFYVWFKYVDCFLPSLKFVGVISCKDLTARKWVCKLYLWHMGRVCGVN